DANAWGADYFISLHANASDIPSASGTEALVYRLGTTAAALGQSLLTGVMDATGLPDRGVTARPELYVLRRTRMPAVLMELGFITNGGDAALMADAPGLFAQGLANGLNAFLGQAVAAVATPDRNPGQGVIEESDEALSYEEFLAQNPYVGRLKVQAFRGDQAYPVPGVQVTVTRKFTDGERLFFAGQTDANGIIDGIELPAAARQNSLDINGPVTTAVYAISATHPQYQPMYATAEIYEGVTAIQPFRLMLKEG
ncbi:MAG: N-acetylmuramoyl-L-alanine amidase, partial [Clostridia bacterium]|nr:N-acetylmuramoyl-L-alanine amidase [Clostridia bacterium]